MTSYIWGATGSHLCSIQATRATHRLRTARLIISCVRFYGGGAHNPSSHSAHGDPNNFEQRGYFREGNNRHSPRPPRSEESRFRTYGGPPRANHKSNSKNSHAGVNLRQIQWTEQELAPIKRTAYIEHPRVAGRSTQDVNDFLQKHELSVSGHPPLPRPITAFDEVGFPDYLISNLQDAGFKEPTPIQSIGWPVAISGRDMVGIAQTGSGKTLSFILPALLHILAQMGGNSGSDGYQGNRAERGARGGGPTVLIMAPTRELAMQIHKEAVRFGAASNVSCTAVYGGTGRHSQQQNLQRGSELVVATPGRLLDFLEAGVLRLNNTSYFVLDEADRMLDMGFEPQIRSIISQMRPDRQTLMWSATWPKEVQQLARTLLNPEPVSLTAGTLELRANPMIAQDVIVTPEMDRRRRFFDTLRDIRASAEDEPKILIFCTTKKECGDLCRNLRYQQFSALAIHGDKSQMERDNILHDYRAGRASILVATDVAARGLDIRDIQYVINYDLPKTVEDYVHRIGRTGRAGASGRAITFVPSDIRTGENIRFCRSLADLISQAGQTPSRQLIDVITGR